MFRIQKGSLVFDISVYGDDVDITCLPTTKGEPSTIQQIVRNETVQARMYLRYFSKEQSEKELMGFFSKRGYTVTRLLPTPVTNELGDITLVYAVPAS